VRDTSNDDKVFTKSELQKAMEDFETPADDQKDDAEEDVRHEDDDEEDVRHRTVGL
jgi:hypothetical protein